MCGIVGFLSAGKLERDSDLGRYAGIADALMAAAVKKDWDAASAGLGDLAQRFDDLMAFSVFRDIVTDTDARALFEALAAALKTLLGAVTATIDGDGSSDQLRQLNEGLRDYLWQVETEVLGFAGRAIALLPEGSPRTVPALFTAWATERVMDSLDKLEVRGRDSAGISIALPLKAGWVPASGLAAELERRAAVGETATGEAMLAKGADGRPVLRVLHKVANLVGRLGDNGATLRAAIKADTLLWAAAEALDGISIIAHTRWASNGIISIANCHPVDGRVVGTDTGRDVLSVINGDIDNYGQLMATGVIGRGLECNRAVTTDAKILPVKLTLETEAGTPVTDRLMTVLRGCRGSLATAVQLLEQPAQLGIGQQGSGQALYLGEMADGWLFASEVYGLAASCRSNRALNTGGEIGVAITLSVENGKMSFDGRRLTGEAWEPPVDKIGIFSRDIFRGDFEYFILKELAEAPDSVRKTLVGKYTQDPSGVKFLVSGFGNGAQLAQRLRATDKMPIRRIVVIGHGTASIAGLGIVHLLRHALVRSNINVEWCKASELFGFASNNRMDDAILIAVSQSGTTTDTNRIVDIARKRGAWVHAIVNRRNSALVQKSDSYLYTSDGRDVEMSVASTKAYYSQVAAGKVLSLFIASELGALDQAQLRAEVVELDTLPGKIRTVLDMEPRISELAETYALKARNWAMVGNGANRVAAEEIRIKLSELCYKAIPCDVTEDKKHIDLSTEPLTMVVANDLPEEVVQDTVKEVAIFKAHNGRPLVLCTEGETRFDGVAQAVIPLPAMGAGMAFVLATVAGHLFGVAAARGIDRAATPVRTARAVLAQAVEDPALWNAADGMAALEAVADTIESGVTDTAMPAAMVTTFMRRFAALARQDGGEQREAMLATLNAMVEELSRPIDTIRHQAKTVTVGVSRPQQELSPLIEEVLWRLNLSSAQMKDADREVLEAISPLINMVKGAVRYATAQAAGQNEWTLTAEAALGGSKVEQSRYAQGAPAAGSKRTVLRTGTLQFSTGRHDDQSIVVVPVWRDGAPRPTDLLLVDLDLIPEAPTTQMVSVLKAMNSKYDEVLEAIEEHHPGFQVTDLLQGLSPRDVVLREPNWLVTRTFN